MKKRLNIDRMIHRISCFMLVGPNNTAVPSNDMKSLNAV